MEYNQQWPEVLLLDGCLTLDSCKLTFGRHAGVSSLTGDSLPVQSTLIVRHVTKPGIGRGRSTAGGFAFVLESLFAPAVFERFNTPATMDRLIARSTFAAHVFEEKMII